jgi:hypothetical protein
MAQIIYRCAFPGCRSTCEHPTAEGWHHLPVDTWRVRWPKGHSRPAGIYCHPHMKQVWSEVTQLARRQRVARRPIWAHFGDIMRADWGWDRPRDNRN